MLCQRCKPWRKRRSKSNAKGLDDWTVRNRLYPKSRSVDEILPIGANAENPARQSLSPR